MAKSAKKKAPSTGKSVAAEKAASRGCEAGRGEGNVSQIINAGAEWGRQHDERFLPDDNRAPKLNMEERGRESVALQNSAGSWALENVRSTAGHSKPSVLSEHSSSSLGVASSVCV
jgi:hypothetical protein